MFIPDCWETLKFIAPTGSIKRGNLGKYRSEPHRTQPVIMTFWSPQHQKDAFMWYVHPSRNGTSRYVGHEKNPGWWLTYPSWKMMDFVSWDDEIPNIWKNMSQLFQTTNQNPYRKKKTWPRIHGCLSIHHDTYPSVIIEIIKLNGWFSSHVELRG